ncbi:MAG: hypothetical protein ACRDXX_20560, partial [Stackebrandtia sp.]
MPELTRLPRAVVAKVPFLRPIARRAWHSRRRLARFGAAAAAVLWVAAMALALVADLLTLAVALTGLVSAAALGGVFSLRRRVGRRLAAIDARNQRIEVAQRRVLASVERE